MPSFPKRLLDRIGSRVAQLQLMAIQGIGADRTHRILREQARTAFNRIAPIPRQVIRDFFRTFRPVISEKTAQLPRLRSQRVKASMAVPTEQFSPLGFRYLWTFSFDAVNPATGERIKMTNTLGFRRLDRLGVFHDAVRRRLHDMNQFTEGIYLPIGFEADIETFQMGILQRTRNR